MKGTDGWNLIPELEKIFVERDAAMYEKITFGCPELAEDLLERNKKTPIESIELVGLCTDICVVSNALPPGDPGLRGFRMCGRCDEGKT